MRFAIRRFSAGATSASPNNKHFDVLINGGGIVGAVFASSLLKELGPGSNIKIGIIDPRKPPSLKSCLDRTVPDVRVYAMAPKSIQILDKIDSWKLIAPRSQAYDSMQVWESSGPGVLRFNARECGHAFLGSIVEDSTMQAAIYQSIEEAGYLNNIEFLFGHTMSALSVSRDDLSGAYHTARATLTPIAPPPSLNPSGSHSDAISVTSRLIVGADGAASAVRKLSGGSSWGWNYGQEAIVATVRLDPSTDNHTAWQRYLKSGPLALLPLWDGYSSIVWSLPVLEARKMAALSREAFLKLLNEALQDAPKTDRWSVLEPTDAPFSRPVRELASLADAIMSAVVLNNPPGDAYRSPPIIASLHSPIVSFPLQFQQASKYTSPRIALIGDAAHSIHPQAGQGLNLGIADADVLARAVSAAIVSGGDIGDHAMLQSQYGHPQYAANLAMMGAVDSLNSIFSYEGRGGMTVQLARSLGMLAINSAGPLKSQIATHAMGISRPGSATGGPGCAGSCSK